MRNPNGKHNQLEIELKALIKKYSADEDKNLLHGDKTRGKTTQDPERPGSFSLDFKSGLWESSEILDNILGIDKNYIRNVEGWSNLIHPDDRKEVLDYLQSCIENRIPFHKEYRIIRPSDNQIRHLLTHGGLITDSRGIPVRFVGIDEDITDAKETGRKLRINEERLRLAVKSANQGLFDYDLASGEFSINDELATILGYNPGEIHFDFAWWQNQLHPEDREKTIRIINDCINGIKSEYEIEYRIMTKSGEWKWIHSVGKSVEWNSEGKPIRLIGMKTDIEDRKRTEEALQESELKYRTIIHNFSEGFVLVNERGMIEEWNASMENITGLKRDDALGQFFWDIQFKFTIPEHRSPTIKKSIEEMLKGVLEGKELSVMNKPIEVIIERQGGERRIIRQTAFLIQFNNKRFIASLMTDITKSRQAEETVRKRDQRFQLLFNNMLNGFAHCLMLFDENGEGTDFQYLEVNPAFEKLTGLKDVVGKKVSEVIPGIKDESPELFKIYGRVARTGEPENLEIYFKPLGIWFSIAVYSNEKNYFVAIFDNITERKQAEIALRESESRLRSILENTDAGYFFIDKDGYIRNVNSAWVKLYHYNSPDEIIGKHFTVVQKLEDLNSAKEFVDGILKGEEKFMTGEFSRRCKDNEIGYHSFSARPVTSQGEVIGIEGFIIDITERKKIEKALKESEEQFRKLFETMTEGVAIHEIIYNSAGLPSDYIIKDINNAYTIQVGITKPQAIGKKASELYGTGSPPYFDIYTRVAETGNPEHFDVFFEPLKKHFSISVFSPEKGSFATVFEDITDRKKSEEKIQSSLKEKETLIQELYHRTKNNMQVISALVSLQSYQIKDPGIKNIFKDLENRIRSMALVHQKLYQSQNLSSINLQEYISELVNLLIKSYDINPGKVSLSLELDNVSALIDVAIPCGLILNELISNSLKYAFPQGKTGEIRIQLHRNADGLINLTVSDNGVGVPDHFDFRNGNTIGLQNVFIIGEHQLQGKVEFISSGGITCRILFDDSIYNSRI